MTSKKITIYGIILILVLGIGVFVIISFKKHDPTITKMFGQVEIPTDWPADVPYHPKAKFLKKTPYSKETGDRFDALINLPEDQVRKFYEDGLKEKGWVCSNADAGDMWQFWTKENRRIGINLTKQENNEVDVGVMVYNTTGEMPKISKTFPYKEGTSINGQMGDLPDSIPMYQGLVFSNKYITKGHNAGFAYTSTASYKQLTEYYHKVMIEQGWTLWSDTTVKEGQGDRPMFQEMYKKDKVTIAVRIIPNSKKPCDVIFILFGEDQAVPRIGTMPKS